MKKTIKTLSLSFLAVCSLIAGSASAAQIDLFDWGINIDGTLTLPGDALPASVDASGFDFFTGLGVIEITVIGAGAHSVDGFFDHEIDQASNTFFNEDAITSGAAAAGQSWEIDEPGYAGDSGVLGDGGLPYYGDIFPNFEDSLLDNMMFFDAIDGQSLIPPDDVSMAMGWDFVLAAGEEALITFTLSETNPGGFFLAQFDPDSPDDINDFATIFFSSTLEMSGEQPVPEPGTLLLFSTGLLGLGVWRRKILA